MKRLNILLIALTISMTCQAQQEEIFRSATHHFRLVYPPNWTHKTTKDPNIVTKGDKDGIYINVSVIADPDGPKNAHELTKNDILSMLKEQNPAPELVSYNKQFIDSVPAMMVVSRVNYKTLDLSFNIRMVQYIFVKGGKTFTLAGSADDKSFDQRLPEIRRIISTFKFEDHLYK